MPTQGPQVLLSVTTSGETSFTLNDFRGIERLSGFFEYTLIMTSQSRDIQFDSLMGTSATVTLNVGPDVRTYEGIIGYFKQDDTPFDQLNMWNVYRATLYPKLWLLTFSGQCRIFQNQSVMDIINTVLQENQITFANQVTSAGQQTRDFCVQYNETNFNFISRLMEEEGIFYFFQQNEDGHKLVLADSVDGYSPCPNAETVSFHDDGPHEPFLMTVSSCFIAQRIVPQNNTLKSYNYMTPQTSLKAIAMGTSDAGGGDFTTYDEIYDQQSQGDSFVKVKLQSEEALQKMVEGVSTVPFFLAGYKFTLEQHPREDANKTYVLYEVVHEARILSEGEETPLYRNEYRALPATIPFRTAQKTPKPRIYGSQTATVTGQEGTEIFTEEYGRIKVKFHWDPSEKQDDTTSCWIRVATLWAGQQWGTLFTPRVGQEVVVSFIDGDPDKPLVIGSVYNGQNKPPYLPSEPTKSTLKSQTSKSTGEGTPGYNEFRFEDKQQAEEIYIHAQKDFTIDVQNNQNITIVGGNRTIKLQAQDEQGETREGTQSNDSLTLVSGDKSLEINKGNYSIKLDEGNITVTCSKGDVSFDVTGNISFKCTGNFDVNADNGISFTTSSGNITSKASQNITETAGADISIQSGADITITSGGDITETVAGAYELTGAGDVTITAAGALEVTAGGDAAVTSGGALEVTGGGTVTVTGATVEVTGAMILLNG